MSSVGSSDGSNRQDEVVRRNREDYRNNESELIKKHKTELRRIAEQHYQEIENLKNAHNEQMENARKSSTDTIGEREYKHQKSIDEMRGMHLKQLKQTADENARREETLRRANTGDATQQKNQNDSRFEKLNDDYRKNIAKYEEAHKEATAAGREAQASAIAENRAKLEKAYQTQVDSLRAERNEKVKDLQSQMSNYRENSEGRLKEQELRHMGDKNRASDHLMRAVNKERQGRIDSEQNLREGFSDGLETMKGRYEKAMKEERQANGAGSETFKATINDRIDSQVRRLENEKADLKEGKARQETQGKQQQQREMGHLRESYGKNIELALEARDEAVRSNNERNSKDIQQVRGEMSKQMTESGRYYRDRMDENNRINRSAYDNLVDSFDSAQEATKMSTDQRVKQIYQKSEEDKQRMIQMQSEGHSASQTQMRDQVRAVRDVVEGEKNLAVRTMQDQMRKQELQHTEKMSRMVSKYESQIQLLKDQMMKERKTGEENLKRTVDELQRSHKLSVDQLEAKNREQMRQVSTMQGEEVRTLNKRHEEKLDAVLAEVKKT